jgi:flagellar basal body-associated protein FliL
VEWSNVADDNNKEEEQGQDGAKQKRGLPAVLLIAVGAMLGGAGVVFAVPPKTVEVPVSKPVYEIVDVVHPDLIRKEFNPRARVGKGVARVSFKFVYTVREDREQEAFEHIKEHWEQANSDVLLILKTRSMEELQAEAGVRMLEHDLIQALERTMFPGAKDERAASVTRILWNDWLLQ